MEKEERSVVFDKDLEIEAIRFRDFVRPFPNHFHDYYVLGCIEAGERDLLCNGKEYRISKGAVLLFNPHDIHGCVQRGESTMEYRAFNISEEVMARLISDVTGKAVGKTQGSRFFPNVIFSEQVYRPYLRLHELVMKRSQEFEKEEILYFLLVHLLLKHGGPIEKSIQKWDEGVEKACRFIDLHYREKIGLEDICRNSGFRKSTLLRAFTRVKRITPYNYLMNIRIGRAKTLLENGVPPVEAALKTGFSDQSHFSNCFNRVIGLSPGMYREVFEGKKGDKENE